MNKRQACGSGWCCEKQLLASSSLVKKWPFRLGQRRSSPQYCDLIQIFWINLELNKGINGWTKGVQYSIRLCPTLFDICPTSWQTLGLRLFQAKGVRSEKYIEQSEVRKIHQTNSSYKCFVQVGQFVIAHSLFVPTRQYFRGGEELPLQQSVVAGNKS